MDERTWSTVSASGSNSTTKLWASGTGRTASTPSICSRTFRAAANVPFSPGWRESGCSRRRIRPGLAWTTSRTTAADRPSDLPSATLFGAGAGGPARGSGPAGSRRRRPRARGSVAGGSGALRGGRLLIDGGGAVQFGFVLVAGLVVQILDALRRLGRRFLGPVGDGQVALHRALRIRLRLRAAEDRHRADGDGADAERRALHHIVNSKHGITPSGRAPRPVAVVVLTLVTGSPDRCWPIVGAASDRAASQPNVATFHAAR